MRGSRLWAAVLAATVLSGTGLVGCASHDAAPSRPRPVPLGCGPDSPTRPDPLRSEMALVDPATGDARWTARFASLGDFHADPDQSALAIGSGVVAFQTFEPRDDRNGDIVVVDLVDGHERWRASAGFQFGAARPIVAGQTVAWADYGYPPVGAHSVVGADIVTGERRFERTGVTSGPVSVDPNTIVVSVGEPGHVQVVGLDSSSGVERWSTPVAGEGWLQVNDGIVLAQRQDGAGRALAAIDARRGGVRWEVSTNAEPDPAAAPPPDRVVVVGVASATAMGVDDATGQLLWRAVQPGAGGPARRTSSVVTWTQSSAAVPVLDAALGTTLWTSQGWAEATPDRVVVWVHDDPSLSSGAGGSNVGYDARTGTMLYHRDAPTGRWMGPPDVVQPDLALSMVTEQPAGVGGTIEAFDPVTGADRWQRRSEIPYLAAVAVPAGVLVVTSEPPISCM